VTSSDDVTGAAAAAEIEGGARLDAGPPGDLGLHRDEHVARGLRDLTGEVDGFAEERRGRDDAGDEPEGERLGGVDAAAGQDQIARPCAADEVMEWRVDDLAEPVLRMPEAGGVGADP
jgi:hypothetical protein